MVRFLIDENLPYYFNLWNSKEFIHVIDLVKIKTDSDIWDYAKKNNLIIVTKDSDFSKTYADKQMINFTSDLKLEVLNYGNNLLQPKFFQILK